MTSERLKIRLGESAGPLATALRKAAAAAGRSLAGEATARLAESLGVEAPALEPGNPQLQSEATASTLGRKAAKARHGQAERPRKKTS